MLIPGYRISAYFSSQEAEPRDRRARLAWSCQEGAHLRRKVKNSRHFKRKETLALDDIDSFCKKFSERTQYRYCSSVIQLEHGKIYRFIWVLVALVF